MRSSDGAGGAAEAVAAAVAGGFAPKHGVRVVRRELDLALVAPLLHAEPICALDLEGELSSGPGCAVDLIQVYLPTRDLVLLVHCADLGPGAVRAALGGWLQSRDHVKVLCDVRADAEALLHRYAIRLEGVLDVQLAHAMLSGDLPQPAAGAATAATTAPAAAAASPEFFYPTGLSRLVAKYGGDALGAELTALKSEFGAYFGAEQRPFRAWPLSARALTYAASDAWCVWLVHASLWPLAERAGLGAALRAAAEQRACEFRDVSDGRQRWETALATRRAEKEARRASAPAAVPARRASASPYVVSTGRTAEAAAAEREARRERKRANRAAKVARRVLPRCECCGVDFNHATQLAAHNAGKRHAAAAAVAAKAEPPPLRVHCAAAPLDEVALRAALRRFGELRKLRVHAAKGEKAGRALAVFKRSAGAARAVAQRKIVVEANSVVIEAYPDEKAEAYHKRQAERAKESVSGILGESVEAPRSPSLSLSG